MFERPSMFKVPSVVDNDFTIGACGGYECSCKTDYSSGCVDGGYEGGGSSSSTQDWIETGAAVLTAVATVVIAT